MTAPTPAQKPTYALVIDAVAEVHRIGHRVDQLQCVVVALAAALLDRGGANDPAYVSNEDLIERARADVSLLRRVQAGEVGDPTVALEPRGDVSNDT